MSIILQGTIDQMVGKSKLLLIPIFLLLTSMSYAADLGVVGQTYTIKEDDFLQFIIKRLHQMQDNGQLDRFNSQLRYNVENHAIRPPRVVRITRARQDKSWNYDPSITVSHDLIDHKGSLIAKMGTVVNPLRMMTIHHDLIFFDGDDKEQVAWVSRVQLARHYPAKLVLVNGSIRDQEKIFRSPIYFDQAGRLTSRFHIEHVPAIVSQEGDYLRIKEVLI